MVSKMFEVAKVEVPLMGQLWRQEQILFLFILIICVCRGLTRCSALFRNLLRVFHEFFCSEVCVANLCNGHVWWAMGH